MKLTELMGILPTPNPSFTGAVTNDDNILAIDTSETQDADFGEFVVAQDMIAGVDAQLNATSANKTYIREGQSDTKTGTQRTFAVTGDRQVGSEFQDYCLDPARLHAVGEKCNVRYIWFCALTGKGEQGKVTILVNSDGSGNAGENAGIDIQMRKTGPVPTPYTYSAA